MTADETDTCGWCGKQVTLRYGKWCHEYPVIEGETE